MRNFKSRFFLSLCPAILLAHVAPGQTVTGSIVGSVADPIGAVIQGASVRLISGATGAVRETKTDHEGNFAFNALVPGTYTVTVEHPGFKRFERTGMELLPNDHLSAGQIALELGTMTESVHVSGQGAAVQTASSERSGVVTSEQVQNLTIVSRDFSVLASLQPGVVYNGAAETQSFSQSARYNVNGGRSTQNNITVDGIPIENSNVGSTNTFISLDAISEVKVQTSNFQAEFGRKPAGAIQAVTKSGTESYHGSAYWDQRNEAFNGTPYNNDIIKTQKVPYRFITAGATLGGPVYIPKLLKRDQRKLFFFFLYEQQREVRPQDTRFVTVPTDLERNGDFSKSLSATSALLKIIDPMTGQQFPGNMIQPPQRINPVGQAFLNQFPHPTLAADPTRLFNGKTYNYVIQESLQVPKNAQTLRVDYNLTSRTSLYGVFNRWWDDEQGFNVPAGNSNWGWLPSEYNPIARTLNVSATHIFNPTLIAESSFGFSRWTEGNHPTQALLDLRNRTVQKVALPQLFPQNNPLDIMPQANFGGIDNPANPTITSRYPISGTEDIYLWSGSLIKVAGPHTMKAGVYYEHWNQIKAPNGNFTGTYDFSGSNQSSTYTSALGNTGDAFANALLGDFFSYTESTTRPPTIGRYNGIEWYAQDSFKASRRLTLDLGIRLGWSEPFHTNDLKEAGFNPALFDPAQKVTLYTAATAPVKTALGAIVPGVGNPLNGTIDRVLDPSYPRGLRTTSGVKAAPRFGFAYDPFGRGTTAIRGGFGIFYDVRERDNFYVNTFKNPPLQQNPIIYFSHFANLAAAANYTFPAATSGFEQDRHIPYVMDYTLSIQQNIGFNTVVDIAYVGNAGRHLLWMRNLNAIPAGTVNPFAASLPDQFYRPYIGYLNILYSEYAGTSNYNALQVSANRRFSSGFVFGAAYTWSKALGFADDETQQVINVPGYTPRSYNYGKLGFDHTHIFKGSWSWDTPKVSKLWDNRFSRTVLDDWKLSGIMTYQTGAPLGISIGTITAINPLTNKVQNFSATQWSGSPTDGARVNLISNAGGRNVVVGVPAQGTLGNAPKYVFAGPPINNWDLALSKQIPLPGERCRLLFNVQAYNGLNHPQFTGVDQTANFNIDSAGVVTQTNKNFLKNNVAGPMRRLQLGLRLSF